MENVEKWPICGGRKSVYRKARANIIDSMDRGALKHLLNKNIAIEIRSGLSLRATTKLPFFDFRAYTAKIR